MSLYFVNTGCKAGSISVKRYRLALHLHFANGMPSLLRQKQRTLTLGGSVTVRLVSSFTSLDSARSLCTKNNIFPFLVKSSLVKLEISCTVILPPMVSIL